MCPEPTCVKDVATGLGWSKSSPDSENRTAHLMNDGEADAYVPNPFGSEDSVVKV